MPVVDRDRRGGVDSESGTRVYRNPGATEQRGRIDVIAGNEDRTDWPEHERVARRALGPLDALRPLGARRSLRARIALGPLRTRHRGVGTSGPSRAGRASTLLLAFAASFVLGLPMVAMATAAFASKRGAT